ncbi:MAG: alpha-amylase/4-alpha-glucanotransferase domain-containing protein [Candidatus Limnocylindrales bacterium]
MVRRISLALTLHNHQPVGNFGWVLAEVYEHAYAPMIEALERHPAVNLALHYSGPLLDWLVAQRPDAIERLGGLVDRGQIEILGGAYYEPILVALPERDRVGQLLRMRRELEARFGVRPRGAWLAERVWEPDLPVSIGQAGYEWTILDDAHFRSAAIPEEDLWGPYITEDQGHLVRVFGSEQGLRYRIPYREVDEVIGYLRAHATEAGDRVGTMGDDGEKFGAWPTTFEHCWGKGRWVERFFEALEANADWLATTTPSAWLDAHPPVGRVYVPSGSYAEMGEWALPASEGTLYSRVFHQAQTEQRPEARWLRGASWRNFQVKYREVNDLHKRMLRVSAAVEAMADGPLRDRAIDHLYQGQSNDCYWHGLFGGIYISHMRLATYEHLLAAEDLADTRSGQSVTSERLDLDLDGRDEIRLTDAGQVVEIDLDEGAGISSWDIRAVRHALTAVLRRRPEAYHELLRQSEDGSRADLSRLAGDDRPASIHDTVRVKEAGLSEALVYDRYERRSGLVRLFDLETALGDWSMARGGDLGGAVDAPFSQVELLPGRLVARREMTVLDARIALEKTFTLDGDRRRPTLELDLVVKHLEGPPIELRCGIEWTLTMLGGGHNPAAWWDVTGRRTAHDAAGSAAGVTRVDQGNDHIGITLEMAVEPAADAWWAPVETVSNSENGFERVYQGSGLLLSWPLRMRAGDRCRRTIRGLVKTARDRRDDET